MNEVMRFTLSIKTHQLTNRLSLLLGFLALLSLSGCGGGADTEENPNTEVPLVGVYSGPLAATPDVQKFQDTVWKTLRGTNRCGSCHTSGGQSPGFADSNDVNFAYSEALKVINGNLVADLASPESSLMVTKVGLGHHCWLADNSVCAAEIEQLISDWAVTPATTSKEIVLSAPTLRTVDSSKNFPDFADPTNNFATTVYPVLHDTDKGNCVRCHAESASTKQQPYFAQDNVEAAYEAAKQKINLTTPSQSRFVLRMCDLDQTNNPKLCEAHNCWSGDCEVDALTMKTAIELFTGNITATQVDPSLIISRAMKLTDGIVSAGGKRHEANVVALWQFKTGSGNIAYDTSGISPAMNLSLTNVDWVGGYGIEIKDGGRAQALTVDSKKLHDTIKATGQFSIEGWVVPGNVAQQNKNIISYSAGNNARNFTVKQNEYTYESHLRTSETGVNGTPQFITEANDEDAQATQQHIVINYDPTNGGRRIYVNGVDTGDPDTTTPGNFTDWKDNFAFVLGNEAGAALTDLTRQWSGKFRLVAVHNRALTQEQITQNFEAGVGEKFFLLFSVSHLTNVPESYILLEVAQFDSYSYLFNKPTFVSLSATPGVIDIDVKGMRIGINGQEALVGQTFIKLDTNKITSSGQVISSMGTVIAQDQGVANDDFFLSFEQFGSNLKVYLPAVTPAPAAPVDLDPVSAVGLRTFDKLNASMSELTGVPTTMGTIPATFEKLKQQLPTAKSIDTFVSAHVVGIAQLAFEYCDQLVEDTTLRNNFFGAAPYNFSGFGSDVDTAFGTGLSTQKQSVVNALYDRMIGIPVTELDDATVLANAPTRSEIMTELVDSTNSPGAVQTTPPSPENLFDRLKRSCGPGGAVNNQVDCSTNTGTKEFVKAMCASVLGSATLLMQ
jgi:mono/diheme cytochrome c family protein